MESSGEMNFAGIYLRHIPELLGAMRLATLFLVATTTAAGYMHQPAVAMHRNSHRGSHILPLRSLRPHSHHSTQITMLDPGSLWTAYNEQLVVNPLVTKSLTAGFIIGAGDAAAQQIERLKTGEDFDIVRYLRWAIFGLVLQGPWNHAFYLFLDSALPPTEDPFTLVTLEKIGIDQFIQAPIFTMIILAFFAIVEGRGLTFAKNQIQNDLGGILLKNWSVFLPATAINIAYCPPELRVLFLNCVFFGWVVYLSLFLNEESTSEQA